MKFILLTLAGVVLSSGFAFAKESLPRGVCGKLVKRGHGYVLSHEGDPDDKFEKAAVRELDQLMKKQKSISPGKCYLVIGDLFHDDDDIAIFRHVTEIAQCEC